MIWQSGRWAGATVVILASGQSLSIEQCELVRHWRLQGGGRRVIAINTTFRRAPWADVLYGCDSTWWQKYHHEVVQMFHGEQWTQDALAHRRLGVNLVTSLPLPGLGTRPGIIHQGKNGGYQAVNLAYLSGASRIVLLGFDMKGSHWHGQHPLPLTNTKPYLFGIYLQEFDRMATDLLATQCEVVNCTPGSAMKCFPTAELEQVLGLEISA